MRKVKYAAIGFLAVFTGIWLALTYANLEPNPLQWEEDTRVMHAILSLTLGIMGGLALEDLLHE